MSRDAEYAEIDDGLAKAYYYGSGGHAWIRCRTARVTDVRSTSPLSRTIQIFRWAMEEIIYSGRSRGGHRSCSNGSDENVHDDVVADRLLTLDIRSNQRTIEGLYYND